VGNPARLLVLNTDLRQPQMEEIGDRATVFEFAGLHGRQRHCIDWVVKNSVDEGVASEDVVTDAASTRLGAKLRNAAADRPAHGARSKQRSRSAPNLSTRMWSRRCCHCGSTTWNPARPGAATMSAVWPSNSMRRGPKSAACCAATSLARSLELMDETRAAGLPT
jgi:hypothetical protein